MHSKNSTYGIRASGGRHGDVFTKPQIVDYMLDLVGYTADKDLSSVSIMEPSCGEGRFIMSIIRRLKESQPSVLALTLTTPTTGIFPH